MKERLLLSILLSISFMSSCQIPDSLIGIYSGLHYYKSDPYLNWTILPDTEYITAIDTSICHVNLYGSMMFGGNQTYFYSNYTYCNGNPTWPQVDVRFYNTDSLKILADNMPTLPPNVHYTSTRFFGKRIPGSSYVGIKENSLIKRIRIFPNPCEDNLFIELPGINKYEVNIYNIFGNKVFSKVMNNSEELNLGFLKSGVYVLSFTNKDGKTFYKKILRE